jgi:hypothetical protein
MLPLNLAAGENNFLFLLFICTWVHDIFSSSLKTTLMEAINIRLYEIFKQDFNLSDAKAKEFTQAVATIAKEKADETFESFKSSIREDFLKLEMKLELKIEQTKTELLKWFIGGFITIVLMLIGLFATIVLRR